MSDKNTPITEQDFIGGVRVVDIGDYRVARGMSRRPFSGCHHRSLVYDKNERRIWCKDCERDVEAFDAFEGLVKNFHAQNSALEKRESVIKEAESHSLISVAAKEVDRIWRSKSMVPACPHCGHGLFPEHFKNGGAMLGKEFAQAAINRKANAMTDHNCSGEG